MTNDLRQENERLKAALRRIRAINDSADMYDDAEIEIRETIESVLPETWEEMIAAQRAAALQRGAES